MFETSPFLRTFLVFDIDGTLTRPREPITEDMVKCLNNLKVPFSVAGGSDFSLLEGQFFVPLYEYGFRGGFFAYLSNGVICYHCNYTKDDYSIRKMSDDKEYDIKLLLGKKRYAVLVEKLETVLDMDIASLPKGIVPNGLKIGYRSSMINFCPIGRTVNVEEQDRLNRELFVVFDGATGYRVKLMEFLESYLSEYEELEIRLGGETSFDIFIRGNDKTKVLRYLLGKGKGSIMFIGDALYHGGNDSVVREFADGYKGKCIMNYVNVHNAHLDTMELLRRCGWVV
jgi:phosphomannomutase